VEAEAALNVVVTSSANGQIVDRISIACRDKRINQAAESESPQKNNERAIESQTGVGYRTTKELQCSAPRRFTTEGIHETEAVSYHRPLARPLTMEREVGAKRVEDSIDMANAGLHRGNPRGGAVVSAAPKAE